jgi:hypothetical protein
LTRPLKIVDILGFGTKLGRLAIVIKSFRREGNPNQRDLV